MLPGEDPQSAYIEDSELWVEIYGELIQVTSGLLERLDGSTSTDADVEVGLLMEQRERFHRRLAFWQSRLRELTPTWSPDLRVE